MVRLNAGGSVFKPALVSDLAIWFIYHEEGLISDHNHITFLGNLVIVVHKVMSLFPNVASPIRLESGLGVLLLVLLLHCNVVVSECF
jgi:hypothetical protein